MPLVIEADAVLKDPTTGEEVKLHWRTGLVGPLHSDLAKLTLADIMHEAERQGKKLLRIEKIVATSGVEWRLDQFPELKS